MVHDVLSQPCGHGHAGGLPRGYQQPYSLSLHRTLIGAEKQAMSVELVKSVNQQIKKIREWLHVQNRSDEAARIILKLVALVEHLKVELERKDS
jgi:hypothetical protein